MEETLVDLFRMAPVRIKFRFLSLLGAGLLTVILATTAVTKIWKTHRGKDATEEVLERSVDAGGVGSYRFPYEIKQVSMAIMNRTGSRTSYAQFTLILDCPSEEGLKMMALNRAKIIDALFEEGSAFYLDDFSTDAPKAFERFKAGLLERYQKYFGSEAPRQVAFHDWFIN